MPVVCHPEDGMVYICPECEAAAEIRRRMRFDIADGDEEYRCAECGHRFDEPDERERRGTATGGHPAKYESELEAMDPDDLTSGGAT